MFEDIEDGVFDNVMNSGILDGMESGYKPSTKKVDKLVLKDEANYHAGVNMLTSFYYGEDITEPDSAGWDCWGTGAGVCENDRKKMDKWGWVQSYGREGYVDVWGYSHF